MRRIWTRTRKPTTSFTLTDRVMILDKATFRQFQDSGYTAEQFSEGLRAISERMTQVDFKTIRALTEKEDNEMIEVPLVRVVDDKDLVIGKAHVTNAFSDQMEIHFIMNSHVAALMDLSLTLEETTVLGETVKIVRVHRKVDEEDNTFRIKGLG